MSRGTLTVAQGTAMTIGAVLGTGVLSLPVLAARVAGPASLIAWAALLLISVALATTFSALGSRYPDGGGVAHFARLAFGRSAGAAVGWCFYVAIPLGAPAAAGFGAAYVADVIGGGQWTRYVTIIVLVAVVALMNWYGIQVSGRVQLAIAGTLAVLLALATAVSLPHASLANLTPFAPYGVGGVIAAAAMLVWAFAGWEAVASLSAEYTHPARDIPKATTFAVAVISVLYLGVAWATVAVLGSRASDAPLSDLLQYGFGVAARPLTALVALLLSLGAMNAYFASSARLGAALAQEGLLPHWLAVTVGERAVPRRSLVVSGAAALVTITVLMLSGLPSESTLLLVTGCFTLVYLIGTAAAIKLLARGSGPWWAAVIAFAATVTLAFGTGWHLIPALCVATAAVVTTRLVQSRRDTREALHVGD
ncbi:MAG: amino acid permease [Propionibacteriaceae bacterium]|mgnify:CR=1 FL=1|nr:amino acid permease [Micropruina sp.]HBX82293.1 amino acid permease [Propionibacteriaceae bacterium]HBY22797.1 amino acid permease [Propionibacteriaceae bacterium]